MGKGKIGKEKAALHLKAIEEVDKETGEVTTAATSEPVQMEIKFAVKCKTIQTKEITRSLETIGRELMRLGHGRTIVCSLSGYLTHVG